MRVVTLIPGDGIGPEISEAVVKIFEAAKVPIEWEIVQAGAHVMEVEKTPLPRAVIDSIEKNKVALKGPITTPIGFGFRSVNVTLRQTFNLYAGIEHQIGDVAAESIKIVTKKASERIAKVAFDLAIKQHRKLVTAVHKANIMKLSDGLFLDCVRKIKADYPSIDYHEQIVDAMCMNLVMNPQKSDVLVMGNLYGDILSDLCAGLVGGLGLVPGANLGDEVAIFEAVHGSAPDIAGQNIANPTALLQSSILMLRHLNLSSYANQIEKAMMAVYEDGLYLTKDVGGEATLSSFTEQIIEKIIK